MLGIIRAETAGVLAAPCLRRTICGGSLPPQTSRSVKSTSERASTPRNLVNMPQRADNENEDALQSDVALATLFDVRGKVVVISGGGSGLGAMMATGFVRNGATLYIFSRKDTSHFAAELTATGPGTCTAVVADAQQPATVEALVHRYVSPSTSLLLRPDLLRPYLLRLLHAQDRGEGGQGARADQ